MIKKMDTVFTAILAVCAIVMVTMAARTQLARQSSQGDDLRTLTKRESRLAARAGLLLGSRDAAVKIVEFADYQCPFCSKAVTQVARLVEESDGRVAVLYRHLLIPGHPNAELAAIAAECAAKRGYFAEVHGRLFHYADSLNVEVISRVADESGVRDKNAFLSCVRSSNGQLNIKRDMNDARQLELSGTPTFVVGRTVIEGVPEPGQLENAVRSELARAIKERGPRAQKGGSPK